jgi:hypothetical protein
MPDQSNMVATPLSAPRLSLERSFYVVMALCALAVVVLGFATSLIDTIDRNAPPNALVALHGLISVAWLLTFLAQATFAATRRLVVHRRLGTAAALLAASMIISGYFVAVTMGRRGYDLSGDLHIENDPLLGIVNPLGDIAAFAVLVTAGYLFRHRSDIHKRLMLLATAGALMPAPLAHLIGHSSVLSAMPPPVILVPLSFFLFASAVYDRFTVGRAHPVSLWGAVVLVAWQISLNAVIGPSEAWHRVAQWLIS